MAEEIGHHETSVGDILDQTYLDNVRQELKARRWAYEKILPIESIFAAFQLGIHQVWELAEHLEVDEKFLYDALVHYGLV